MIHLIVPFFLTANNSRNEELYYCLKKNSENELVNSITVILEEENTYAILQEKIILDTSKKITISITKNRCKFSDAFRYCKSKNINVILNSDIYLTDQKIKWKLLKNTLPLDVFIVLTRTELDGTLFRDYAGDSQDVWIIRNKIDDRLNGKFGDYYFGVPGCDNKITYELHAIGYQIINLGNYITAIHDHTSNLRFYTNIDRLPGPYLLVKPTGVFWYLINCVINLLNRGSRSFVFDVSKEN